MIEFIKIAWRNLWRNKRRTVVISLAIALGVWGVLVAIGVDNAFVYQMMDNFIYTHLGHIEIHAQGFNKNPSLRLCITEAEEVIEKVKGTEHIAGYAPRIKAFSLAQSPRSSQGVMLVGIDPELEPTVTRIKSFITEGSYFERDDGRAALIGEGLAHKLKVDVGDRVTFFTQGYRSEEGVIESLRVIGLYRSGISELDKLMVYVPLRLSEHILEMEGRLSEVAIVVDEDKNIGVVKESLKKSLAQKDQGLEMKSVEITGPEDEEIQLIKVSSSRQDDLITEPEALSESFRLNPQTLAVSFRVSIPADARNILENNKEGFSEIEVIGVDPVDEEKVTGIFSSVDVPRESWLAGSELEKELDVRDDWVILDEGALGKLSAQPGDTITIQYRDESLSMEVAGILRGHVEKGLEKPFALMSRRQIIERLSGKPGASQILVRLKPDADPGDVREGLLAGLGKEVLDWGELYPLLKEMEILMDYANYVFLLCVYIAVAFGIANTMVMSVFERVRELGILKAIGTRPGQLFNMVILECLMLALIGMGLGGVLTAVTMLAWKSHGLDLSLFAEGMEAMGLGTVLYPVLTLENIFFAIIMAFFIAIVSALYPALKASRLLVVEALQRI
jgi:ABC-type lipoprotein release transport system permease subunit